MQSQKTKKQGGFVLTSELILLVTILVIGMIVGLVNMRDAMNAEMHDVAEAFGALDQSYEYAGIHNAQSTAEVAGSAWGDTVDTAAGDGVGWNFTAADTEVGGAVGTTPNPDLSVIGNDAGY